jgi:hypothetical protein
LSAAETTWTHKRAKLARLSQKLPPDAPELGELRTELRTQRTAEYLGRVLSEAPPLTDEQRSRLAELLKPAREAIAQARLAELSGGAA